MDQQAALAAGCATTPRRSAARPRTTSRSSAESAGRLQRHDATSRRRGSKGLFHKGDRPERRLWRSTGQLTQPATRAPAAPRWSTTRWPPPLPQRCRSPVQSRLLRACARRRPRWGHCALQLATRRSTPAAAQPGASRSTARCCRRRSRRSFRPATNAKVARSSAAPNEDEVRAVHRDLASSAAAPPPVPPNFDPTNKSFLLSAAACGPTAAALSAGTGVSTTQLTTVDYPLTNFGTDTALQPALGAGSLRHRRDLRLQRQQRVQAGAHPGLCDLRVRVSRPDGDPVARPRRKQQLLLEHAARRRPLVRDQYLFNFGDGRPAKNAEQSALALR